MYRVGRAGGVTPRPSWWKLYASLTPVLGFVALVHAQASAGVGRTVLQISAAVVLFGVMGRWVRVNRVALALDVRRGSDWRRAATEATALAWTVSHGDDVMHRARAVRDDLPETRRARSKDKGVRYVPVREARGGG